MENEFLPHTALTLCRICLHMMGTIVQHRRGYLLPEIHVVEFWPGKKLYNNLMYSTSILYCTLGSTLQGIDFRALCHSSIVVEHVWGSCIKK